MSFRIANIVAAAVAALLFGALWLGHDAPQRINGDDVEPIYYAPSVSGKSSSPITAAMSTTTGGTVVFGSENSYTCTTIAGGGGGGTVNHWGAQ